MNSSQSSSRALHTIHSWTRAHTRRLVPAQFPHSAHVCQLETMRRGAKSGKETPCVSMLFDSCFLHDGHIGGRSSSRIVFGFGSGISPLSAADVDSADLEGTALGALSKDHFTGIRFFRLCFVSTIECMDKLQVDYLRKWVCRVSVMTRRLHFHV